MSQAWENVPLGELLTRSEEWIEINPEDSYRQVTVRMHGQGVVQRDVVTGAEIAAPSRLVVRPGQFIISRLDARNGASGLVPDSLDGAVVSTDFPVFNVNRARLASEWLGWLSKTPAFVDLCTVASEGTTNRVRLKEDRFLATPIPLPSLTEQRRIVARIEALTAKIEEAQSLQNDATIDEQRLLLSSFSQLVAGARRLPMGEAAPLVRRPVRPDLTATYTEIGIRSFGNGTFHKTPSTGADIGTKRVFQIHAGDLLFNIVFAWEGAVAVAKPEDQGLIGSHRFLTCVPKKDVATAPFLCFYFLTQEGLSRLLSASPGGAGRNRTLGLNALEQISVPVPPIDHQHWFDSLQAGVAAIRSTRTAAATSLQALLPSILDKAFQGEL
jgi:type I restriction enzyme S subunit